MKLRLSVMVGVKKVLEKELRIYILTDVNSAILKELDKAPDEAMNWTNIVMEVVRDE